MAQSDTHEIAGACRKTGRPAMHITKSRVCAGGPTAPYTAAGAEQSS
jgi:hypothetical protein